MLGRNLTNTILGVKGGNPKGVTIKEVSRVIWLFSLYFIPFFPAGGLRASLWFTWSRSSMFKEEASNI